MERVHLYFALGKALEDRKNFQDSFSYYEEGNNLKKAQSRYTAENMSADFVKQKKLCIPSFFSSRNVKDTLLTIQYLSLGYLVQAQPY